MFLEIILDYWGVVVGFITFVVWLIRLEGKAVSNTRDIVYIHERRNEDLRAAKEAREETAKRLDEILNDVRESNRDIKDILRKFRID